MLIINRTAEHPAMVSKKLNPMLWDAKLFPYYYVLPIQTSVNALIRNTATITWRWWKNLSNWTCIKKPYTFLGGSIQSRHLLEQSNANTLKYNTIKGVAYHLILIRSNVWYHLVTGPHHKRKNMHRWALLWRPGRERSVGAHSSTDGLVCHSQLLLFLLLDNSDFQASLRALETNPTVHSFISKCLGKKTGSSTSIQ